MAEALIHLSGCLRAIFQVLNEFRLTANQTGNKMVGCVESVAWSYQIVSAPRRIKSQTSTGDVVRRRMRYTITLHTQIKTQTYLKGASEKRKKFGLSAYSMARSSTNALDAASTVLRNPVGCGRAKLRPCLSHGHTWRRLTQSSISTINRRA